MESTITSETYKSLNKIALLCNRATFLPDQQNIPILKRETAGKVLICVFSFPSFFFFR